MRRREFLGALGGVAVWPIAARAQQGDRIVRVGFFSTGRTSSVTGPGYQAFVEELRKRGFGDGRNLILDVRSAQQDLRGYLADVADLARLNTDVIVAGGPEASLQAAIANGSGIPVVMVAINYDPIARGYIKGLSHPGGNITGVFLRQNEVAEKMVELLAQTFPERTKLALLWDRFSIDQLTAADRQARATHLGVRALQLENPPYDFDAALQTVADEGGQMAMFLSSPFFASRSEQIAASAVRLRLPTMFWFRGYVEGGGLISYGADLVEMYRQAAAHVSKILRGAKPADLPVEQPNKFELVVNLKTAKALSIDLPTSILLRADEVIE